MNAPRRLSRLNALSYSMPDVTGSPGYYAPAQEIVEEREEEDDGENGRRYVPNNGSGYIIYIHVAYVAFVCIYMYV